jgi:hypothetical protein
MRYFMQETGKTWKQDLCNLQAFVSRAKDSEGVKEAFGKRTRCELAIASIGRCCPTTNVIVNTPVRYSDRLTDEAVGSFKVILTN